MLIDDQNRGWDQGSGDDETVMEWRGEAYYGGEVVIRRHPGTEWRDGEHRPINFFGLFHRHQLIFDGTFECVTNYYWAEFA